MSSWKGTSKLTSQGGETGTAGLVLKVVYGEVLFCNLKETFSPHT
jgi:hypothetical protein